ncbi:hypothetical protein Ndes2526B_g08548 [Nannochloris sp. 'desiccata']
MNGVCNQRWAIEGPCPCNCSRLISSRLRALNSTLSPAYTLNRIPCRNLASIVITNSYSSDNDSLVMSSFDGKSSSYDEDQFGPHATSEPAEALAPSAELRELCHLQLTMLVTSLEARLALLEETGVRCAIYRRSPASLPSGQLQLQLVAASDAREAEAAANHRKDLILGIPEANEQYQEAWIVEQNLIVLPDSGGLVLPLAHNQFLVGLLVVECCSPDSNAPYSGSLAGSLHPPACAVFSPADMALIKQNGTALGLACALDLRAALERAGHAVRRRQVQGLVRQARKPLSTLRTLGAMLAPRLQEGEPERDMTESIMAQGQTLGEIVSQLQAFLAPSMPTVRIGTGGSGGPRQQQQQQQQDLSREQQQQSMLSAASFMNDDSSTSTSGSSTTSTDDSTNYRSSSMTSVVPTTASNTTNVEMLPSPALPSSSIGGDFWTPPAFAPPSLPSNTTAGGGSSPGASSESSNVDRQPLSVAAPLVSTLAPLLNSAQNFASVSGVTFLLPPKPESSSSEIVAGAMGPAAKEDREPRFTFPETAVPVEPIVLKRMLSQLLDGTIACSARGDVIEFVCEYEGDGVVIATRLVQAIGPGTLTRGGAAAMDSEGGHVFLAEFATLSRLARQAGGWFDVTVEQPNKANDDNNSLAGEERRRENDDGMVEAMSLARGGSSLMAAMWLPSVPLDEFN